MSYSTSSRKSILVLGDSHATVFRHPLFGASFPDYTFEVVSVAGATASGLENPNSKTGALATFTTHANSSEAKTVIVLLGEVDTGFVIWYRSEKHGASVTEMLERALGNYQRLLVTLSDVSRVICISAPLPTIRDDQDWGEVALARRDVVATQRERTALTLQFNNRMQQFCAENGISYLSLDHQSLGQDGLVDSRLLNSNPLDHHFARTAYAEMIVNNLAPLIETPT